jgi:lipopolysaccharide biosynthesis glycosyltransferase
VLKIACGSSPEYAPHAATMMRSVLAHRGGHDVRFYYLHGPDLPHRHRQAIARMVEAEGGAIDLIEIGHERLEGLPAMPVIPSTMWYRTFLPEVLPTLDRVLYLDVDTVVVDSLAPLWETDLGDCYLGAVTNVWEAWNVGYPAALGLSGPEQYFNSGVLLVNLDLVRRDDCMRRAREYALAQQDGLPWGDQDALNVVMGARRLPLHPRWNCMNSVLTFPVSEKVFGSDAVEEARRRPGIRHFEGPALNKPWHLLFEHEGREDYLRHRRGTPWPRYVPAGITPRNVLRRMARGLRR